MARLESLHGVEHTAGVGRGAHEVGGLFQRFIVLEETMTTGSWPARVMTTSSRSLMTVQDFGIAGAGLRVAHALHRSSCTEARTVRRVPAQLVITAARALEPFDQDALTRFIAGGTTAAVLGQVRANCRMRPSRTNSSTMPRP